MTVCPSCPAVSETHVKLQVYTLSGAGLWAKLFNFEWSLNLSFLICKRGLIMHALHREQAFSTLNYTWICLPGRYTEHLLCACLYYFISPHPPPISSHVTSKDAEDQRRKLTVPGHWGRHQHPGHLCAFLSSFHFKQPEVF